MFNVHPTTTGVEIETTSHEMIHMDRSGANVDVADSQRAVRVSWTDLRDAFREVAQAHNAVKLANGQLKLAPGRDDQVVLSLGPTISHLEPEHAMTAYGRLATV